MFPPLPVLSDYGISPENGFLPDRLPLKHLPDPYYNKWEAIVANLQALILSKRLRGVIDRLNVLSTAGLEDESEWRRAYMMLAFMAHGYIWGGDTPADRLPPPIAVPLLAIAEHLDIPPVATYAAVCLWNFKPLFKDEGIDTLENLSTLITFTGSLDESWFYLTSVAIEARGGPIIPLMLTAISAARAKDAMVVTLCLRSFAERLDDLGNLLQRMHENCDPHVFYHHIRPFLAGSKNMAEAGLPNGVIYDTGTGNQTYSQWSGGSNAQSSLIQFFDIVLGIQHRPTGQKPDPGSDREGSAPPPKHNFIHEMRKYMPGAHRRFLEHLSMCANIRQFVEERTTDRELCTAYDACLAMLQAFRDKHIAVVTRYVVMKSRETPPWTRDESIKYRQNLALASKDKKGKNNLRGTGGTALLPFLKQARDETSEPAITPWAKKLTRKNAERADKDELLEKIAEVHRNNGEPDPELEVNGLAGSWAADVESGGGGLCHY
jgi:indoleamine 2,3-dioxygenase